MKTPSADNVKAFAYIALAGVGIYAAYKIFKVGSSAADAVSNTVGGAVDAVSNGAAAVGSAISGAYHVIVPNKPPPLDKLPSNNGYPEAGPIKYAAENWNMNPQTHTAQPATGQEVNDYFNWNNGQYSPDAMGN